MPILSRYLYIGLLLITFSLQAETTPETALAETNTAVETSNAIETDADLNSEINTNSITHTLETLSNFANIKNALQKDIKILNRSIDATKSESEKTELKLELSKVQADLKTTVKNMDNVAASVDISRLDIEEEQVFSFQKEILFLLKPAFEEMKDMTAQIRKKSMIREKISYYEERLPIIEEALRNVTLLQAENTDKSLGKLLKNTAETWRKKQAFMQSELQAAQLQIKELKESETSLTEATHSYMRAFFQKRGLYLSEAFLLVVIILLLSKFSYNAMRHYLPGFQKKHRSFRVRLLELFHRIFTVLMVILAPMLVFYLEEDWVLFSLGILLILGIALTLRQTLPLYWQQAQLFLNIGSVREGERLFCDGLPWQVERINFFCTLVNPVAEISQRLPISSLIDLKSRPSRAHEPWFPCKMGDWVILSDDLRGKVIGISIEMVQLVQRGGLQATYQTADFLAHSPRNLSTNFRLKELIGISYNLQHDSTRDILVKLRAYILERAEQESYSEQLLNLSVEFAQAGNSSLDIAIIADFKGELAPFYNRLRRCIQRWCVDACSQYNWEIPFPQMTLHGLAQSPEKPLITGA